MVFIKKPIGKLGSIKDFKEHPILHNFRTKSLLGECEFDGSYNTAFITNLPYVVIAVIAAFIGLSNNDPTIVIASMLFSPIGGQILRSSVAMVEGNSLQFGLGMLNHMLYVFIIWLLSYLGGLLLDEKETMHIKNGEIGNSQMLARAQWNKTSKGVITSIILAVAAGIILALSHSNKDASMIVGIGIGASLLPPLVNSGILTAMSSKSQKFDYNKMAVDSFLLWLLNYALMMLTMSGTFKLFCKKPNF